MPTLEPLTREEAARFVRLVREMREAQKAWFSGHAPSDLTRSKKLERAVDKALKEMVSARQGSFF